MSIQANNARNQFRGKVREIIRGPVVSEVDVETPHGIVTSVITTRSVDELNLSVGSEVIALENILAGHPAVQEAAAVAVPHPKWDERPLMAVVLKPGARLDRDAMRGFYDGKVARWWIPDDLAVVDEIPHTATGKINKRALRERLQQHRWTA